MSIFCLGRQKKSKKFWYQRNAEIPVKWHDEYD